MTQTETWPRPGDCGKLDRRSQLGQLSADIDQQLGFERLISDLSATLVAAADDDIPAAVESALGRLIEFFGADRGGMLAVDSSRRVVRLVHAWYAPEFAERVPLDLNLAEMFPRTYSLVVERRQPQILSRVDDLPPEAARDRAGYVAMGIRSNFAFPIVVGSAVRYVISLDAITREVHWPPSYVPRLQVLGTICANAIERKRMTDALRLSEARLALAAQSAGAGPWDLDIATGRIWATPEAKALYGFAQDAEVTLDQVLGTVHPDDAGRVRDRVTAVSASGGEFLDEYRVVLPGGGERWLNARGRARAEPDGTHLRMTGISIDVTARKRAEAELRSSEARLQAALDIASIGCYVVTDGWTVSYVDTSCRDILGMPKRPGGEAETLAYWVTHLHPDDRGHIEDLLQQLNEGRIDRRAVEYRYLHPERGTVWIHHSARVLDRRPDGFGRTMIGAVRDITDVKRAAESLEQANADLQRLRDQLERENTYLRQEATALKGRSPIVSQSAPIRRVLSEIEKVAPTDSTVLLLGETGVGKELLAGAIHDMSPRRERTMVRVNCAAIPATLIEAELFGREKGAYTGALSKQVGRFEMASGSTIFLDEIGDLPPEIQVKLLRVIQERQIERLGSPRPVSVNLRIIAATHRDLAREVRAGRFREDLFYRLNVFPIRVPSLRERLDDLPLLVDSLVDELAGRIGKRVRSVSRASLERLARYDWPGNVRELRNVIERAIILSTGPVLEIDIPDASEPDAGRPGPRQSAGADREHVLRILQRTGWRIRGKGGAAEQLGLKPTTLEARMARMGIKRP